jgi:hypothetical protein
MAHMDSPWVRYRCHQPARRTVTTQCHPQQVLMVASLKREVKGVANVLQASLILQFCLHQCQVSNIRVERAVEDQQLKMTCACRLSLQLLVRRPRLTTHQDHPHLQRLAFALLWMVVFHQCLEHHLQDPLPAIELILWRWVTSWTPVTVILTGTCWADWIERDKSRPPSRFCPCALVTHYLSRNSCDYQCGEGGKDETCWLALDYFALFFSTRLHAQHNSSIFCTISLDGHLRTLTHKTIHTGSRHQRFDSLLGFRFNYDLVLFCWGGRQHGRKEILAGQGVKRARKVASRQNHGVTTCFFCFWEA